MYFELQQWWKYLKTSIVVILSALLLTLNNLVDNFSALAISGGSQALAYANTWTSLIWAILVATTIVGATLCARYQNQANLNSRLWNQRLSWAWLMVIGFAIAAWINPQQMIKLASGFDPHLDQSIINQASEYLRLIAIDWMIIAWLALILNHWKETKQGVAALIASVLMFAFNLSCNFLLLNLVGFDLKWLAVSTLITNFSTLVIVLILKLIKRQNRQFAFMIKPWLIFNFKPGDWNLWKKQIVTFLMIAIAIATVSIRFIFWNVGYPLGSIGDPIFAISGANILAISGIFFDLVWTTMDASYANTTIWVGSALANDKDLEAKQISKQLHRFHLVLALVMGLILILVNLGTTHFHFLSASYQQALNQQLSAQGYNQDQIKLIIDQGSQVLLTQVQTSIWVLGANLVVFMAYISKKNILAIYNHNQFCALSELIISCIQLGWIAIINYLMKINNFSLAYFVFFLSDWLKVITFYLGAWWLIEKVRWNSLGI